MAEMKSKGRRSRIEVRHRGRFAQIPIYLGKMFRMFVYQNDWKVLPMSALIAGLVGMVIRKRMFLNMEGSLMGSFALACVAIWNGGFNSIQVICRERDVIKREHRSGMHISSYVFSHMVYQAVLCLLQTIITIYFTKAAGIQYPDTGLFTKWFVVDFGISLFLISYASDMMSLWISCLSRTSTTAMTIMPFILIFQLVFSGGMLSLPAWSEPLTHLTISNPGLKVIAAQSDYNNRPSVEVWNLIQKVKDREISGTVTLGQILEMLSDKDDPAMQEIRSLELGKVVTVAEIEALLRDSESFKGLREEPVMEDLTVGSVLAAIRSDENLRPYLESSLLPGIGISVDTLLNLVLNTDSLAPLLEKKVFEKTTVGDVFDLIIASGILDKYKDAQFGASMTVGELVDGLAANKIMATQKDRGITIRTTPGQIIKLLGEKNVKNFLTEKVASFICKPEYAYTVENILTYWFRLLRFVLVFACLSTVTLEFIDLDKR